MTLTLIGKPECHLCEVAHGVIDQVLAELPADIADQIELERLSILEDPALYESWWEKIPVIIIDGEVHAFWRVAPERLRDALQAAAARPVTR